MKIPAYLYYGIAFLWAWSGIPPVLCAEQESLQLLARVGIGETFRQPVFYFVALLDLAFAIA